MRCSGYFASKEERAESAGSRFERAILKVVQSWLDRNGWMRNGVVHKFGTGLQINESAEDNSRSLTDWDVYVTLRDGAALVLECKSSLDIEKLLKYEITIKDLQSRLHVLREAASTASKFLVVVRIAKEDTPEALGKTLKKLDNHFRQALKLEWAAH